MVSLPVHKLKNNNPTAVYGSSSVTRGIQDLIDEAFDITHNTDR